jgi:hypothetical protein
MSPSPSRRRTALWVSVGWPILGDREARLLTALILARWADDPALTQEALRQTREAAAASPQGMRSVKLWTREYKKVPCVDVSGVLDIRWVPRGQHIGSAEANLAAESASAGDTDVSDPEAVDARAIDVRADDAGRQGANADHFAPEDVTTAAKETAVVWWRRLHRRTIPRHCHGRSSSSGTHRVSNDSIVDGAGAGFGGSRWSCGLGAGERAVQRFKGAPGNVGAAVDSGLLGRGGHGSVASQKSVESFGGHRDRRVGGVRRAATDR